LPIPRRRRPPSYRRPSCVATRDCACRDPHADFSPSTSTATAARAAPRAPLALPGTSVDPPADSLPDIMWRSVSPRWWADAPKPFPLQSSPSSTIPNGFACIPGLEDKPDEVPDADADSQMFLRDRVPQLGRRTVDYPSTTPSPVALGRPFRSALSVKTCMLCFAMPLCRSGL